MAEPEKNELTNPDALDIMSAKIRAELEDMPYGTFKIVLFGEKHSGAIKDVNHEITQKIHHSRN